MSLHGLHYRNDKLMEILHGYVMKMKKYLNIYNISILMNSYAALAPDNSRFLAELGPELHDKLSMAVNSETYK